MGSVTALTLADKTGDVMNTITSLLSSITTIAGLGPAGYVVIGILLLLLAGGLLFARSYLNRLAKEASEEEARKTEAANTQENTDLSDAAKKAREDIEKIKEENSDAGKKERPKPWA